MLASCTVEARAARRPLRRRPGAHRDRRPRRRPRLLLAGQPRQARRAGPRPAGRRARCCCSSAASSPSRASTSPCGRWPRSTAPDALARGRRRARAGPTATPSSSACASWSPTSASRDRVRFVPPQPPRAAVDLLPGRRRVPGAEPVRVVRARRPRGGRLRHAGGRRRRRWAAHARRPRAHRASSSRPRPRRRSPAHVGEILDDPLLARRDGDRARPLRARRYTWSIAAARLRRLYADLTAAPARRVPVGGWPRMPSTQLRGAGCARRR